MVGRGENPRFIDLRGNYTVAIPGTIPVLFEADMFFENEQWVQDMLGVRFHPKQTIILLCEFGQTSEAALDLFMEKNPRTIFDIRTLDGGMLAYKESIEQLTMEYKKRELFRKELLSLSTPPLRFHKIIKGIQSNKRGILSQLFG